MKITFRVDASLEMGTGHVMRCLTLAKALQEQGANCEFICREHQGNLITHLEQQGFKVHRLAVNESFKTEKVEKSEEAAKETEEKTDALAHAAWLGASQLEDAQACATLLQTSQPDWLIVDHYALDSTWETQLRPYTQKIMVIDDLADRKHDCDLLLDQNLGRQAQDYAQLIPENCHLFIGPEFALLRPEFAQWRDYSLNRRTTGELNNILISLGGVDKDNYTSQVLHALQQADLAPHLSFTVIMGATSPHLAEVQQLAASLTNPTQVLVNVNNMAELMANSDLAIGAAGATSWERCCLGLPTLMLVLAENQHIAAEHLHQAQTAILVPSPIEAVEHLKNLVKKKQSLTDIIYASQQLTDGQGVARLLSYF